MTTTETRTTHSHIHRSADTTASAPDHTTPFFSEQSSDTSFFRGTHNPFAANDTILNPSSQALWQTAAFLLRRIHHTCSPTLPST